MPRLAATLTLALSLGLLGGCGSLGDLGRTSSRNRAPVTPELTPEARLLLGHLELLDRMVAAGPAEQAEIMAAARRATEINPTIADQLRFALLLALPDHGGSDAVAARTALGDLLANPERLLPAERSLARVMLEDANARLALSTENEQLVMKADGASRDRSQALNRRVQAQAAEIERLRQSLADAEAKLKAVADLERSLAERKVAPQGQQP